jgi:hypothetical protein
MAPPPASDGVIETVARHVWPGAKPAIYVSGGKGKGKPRAVLAVELLFVGDERIHLLANVALSRCNKDDVTGGGGAGSPCPSMKSSWGPASYPYQPEVSAYFRFSDGKGATKNVPTTDTFDCTEGAHHCPLELAAEVTPDPNLPIVELVVEAKDPSQRAKARDLVELELDDPNTGLAKSTLHVFRIGKDAGAPGLVAAAQPSPGCVTSKFDVKTTTTGNGSTRVLSQTVHVNPWTTHLEIASFADVMERKNGFFVEPLLNSQIVMDSSHGRTELSPRGGMNCLGGKNCRVKRYGSLRVKPGFFGDEDITIAYELGAVRTQKNHAGQPITGTHFMKPRKCGMNVQLLRP